MGITFAAANAIGLNNPGTEIITLVKDGSGNFINPPSYDKMRAYLRSGEVPMLFVTAEGGETGSLYQLDEYSETENKIRFSNSANAIEFCAGCDAPNVSEVGGGVFEVFEATTTDMETLATGPSLNDIAGCYSRGKIPVIKLTMIVNTIQTEFICTTGHRVSNVNLPVGIITFDCIYNDNNSTSSIKPVMKCVSIIYSAESDAPKIQGGMLTVT